MFGESFTVAELGVTGAVAFLTIDKVYNLLKIAISHANGKPSNPVLLQLNSLNIEVSNLKDDMSKLRKSNYEANQTLSTLVGKFDLYIQMKSNE